MSSLANYPPPRKSPFSTIGSFLGAFGILFSLAVTAQADMVGFWNFDNGDATNAVTGTADVALQGTGGAFLDGKFISGGYGYLQGTGTNNTIANLPVGNSAYSISAFVQTTATSNVAGNNYGMGFMGWGNYGGSLQVTAFRASGNNYVNEGLNTYWWAKDMEVYYNANTWGTKLNTGIENHIASTYDGTSRAIYLNGQVVGTDTPGVVHATTNQNFRIGATYPANYEILNGTMDNASLYSNSLAHGDIVNIASSRYNGLVSWWNGGSAAVATGAIDTVSGLAFSATPVAGVTRIANGNQVMDFSQPLSARTSAYYTGQMATGHEYLVDAEPTAWTEGNTAWVRTASKTWDGSTHPLGVYVGGTTTLATLSGTGKALSNTNMTLVLGGGTLSVSDASTYSGNLVIDGGKVTASRFYTGGADILLHNGSIAVTEFRVGHAGTDGNFTMNNGSLSTTWFTFGEGSGQNNIATVTINGGTVTTSGGASIMVGRGGQGVLNINGGTLNANGTYSGANENGAISVGSHNTGTVNLTGGTLNVGGAGLRLHGHDATFNQTGGLLNADSTIEIKAGTTYNFSDGVISGSKLRTTGMFDFTGGILSIDEVDGSLTQKGGVFSPGRSATGYGTIGTSAISGDYNVNDGIVFIEITEEGFDKITVGGDLNFTDKSKVVISYDPEVLQPGQAVEVFEVAGNIVAPSPTPTPSESDWSQLLPMDERSLWIVSATDGGLSFALNPNAVPEPGTWGLMLLGVAGLLCMKSGTKIGARKRHEN